MSFVSIRRSEKTRKHSCSQSLVMASFVSCSFRWALSNPWNIWLQN